MDKKTRLEKLAMLHEKLKHLYEEKYGSKSTKTFFASTLGFDKDAISKSVSFDM